MNEVWLGDCLELMNDIPDNSIDMIFTDLPYGTTKAKWDTPIDLQRMWAAFKRIKKADTPMVMFAQLPFDKVLGASNLKWLRYEWIWEKTQATGHLNAKKMPMKAHENILVFYEKTPKYYPIITDGHKRKVATAVHKRNCTTGELYGKSDNFKDYDSTNRYPRSVLKYPSDKQKLNLHSTQKPLALCEYLVKTYTSEGDVVLDICAGSGTTGVAAKNLNRNFMLMELMQENYEIIIERLKENI